MKKLMVLCVLLMGCVSQQPAAVNVTTSQPKSVAEDFIFSLIILNCSYQHQGCEHAEGFATCLYHMKNTVGGMSEQQKQMLEENMRTEYGFNKKDDDFYVEQANKTLSNYTTCKY